MTICTAILYFANVVPCIQNSYNILKAKAFYEILSLAISLVMPKNGSSPSNFFTLAEEAEFFFSGLEKYLAFRW